MENNIHNQYLIDCLTEMGEKGEAYMTFLDARVKVVPLETLGKIVEAGWIVFNHKGEIKLNFFTASPNGPLETQEAPKHILRQKKIRGIVVWHQHDPHCMTSLEIS